MNSFGQIYRLTTFGESHGPAIGGVIDGMPAGLNVDLDHLRHAMSQRRPGGGTTGATARREADEVQLLSGIYNGVTTGTPIGFIIANTDARSADYQQMAQGFRPCHADYTYHAKYGSLRDPRGGGRSSARETACRVVAGALAEQALLTKGITVSAYTRSIGTVEIASADCPELAARSPLRCPDPQAEESMAALIEGARREGDTLGGTVECVISHVPAGLGEPLYGKLSANLGAAMLSINAARGFEIGMGFEGCRRRGSEVADHFATDADGRIVTTTNHSGGIQGGISNGADIVVRVAFRPVPTMMRAVDTVGPDGKPVTLQPRGRHDVCVVPRAVAVVRAMAACVILDAYLLNRLTLL